VQDEPRSRRDRKKAATRAAIADAALRLFLDRGYENVTVREVAAVADVSPTTLLNHFPSKEALVLDRGDEIAAELTRAVRDRDPATGLVDALRRYARQRVDHAAADPMSGRFLALVLGNRDLADHWNRTWTRHEDVLAAAIRDDVGAGPDDPRPAVAAHFVLGAIALALRSADPEGTVDAAFDLIADGVPWGRAGRGA
jgi:AcrR family transcriptional regulator